MYLLLNLPALFRLYCMKQTMQGFLFKGPIYHITKCGILGCSAIGLQRRGSNSTETLYGQVMIQLLTASTGIIAPSLEAFGAVHCQTNHWTRWMTIQANLATPTFLRSEKSVHYHMSKILQAKFYPHLQLCNSVVFIWVAQV